MTTSLTEHRLGPADEIPTGEGRTYTVGDDQIAVFRLRDGRVRALSAICPHAGGPIADGQTDSTTVVCPLHQHIYELDTGHCRTGQPPLRTYPVRVDDTGHIVVSTVVTNQNTPQRHQTKPRDLAPDPTATVADRP